MSTLKTGLCTNLVLLIITLLTACSTPAMRDRTPVNTQDAEMKSSVAEGQDTDLPPATSTPYPTATLRLTRTPSPTPTSLPTRVPTVIATAVETTAPTEVQAEASTSSPSQTLPPADMSPEPAAPPLELTRIPESGPRPPFTIEVGALRVEDGKYKVTGIVRNDGDETYEGIGVLGTFYTWGPGGRGSSDDGRYPHGPVTVQSPCLFLEPGAECPFSLEIYARNYIAYHLGPKGQPVAHHKWHEPASVTVGALNVSNDGIGNVRITGKVVNDNAFTIEKVTIAGALVNVSGQAVSAGSTTVLGGIEPGAEASFDLRIEHEPYARYKLYVQGARY